MWRNPSSCRGAGVLRGGGLVAAVTVRCLHRRSRARQLSGSGGKASACVLNEEGVVSEEGAEGCSQILELLVCSVDLKLLIGCVTDNFHPSSFGFPNARI